MGKLPPGLREAQSQVASLISRRQAIITQHHERVQSEYATPKSPNSRHFPNKFSRKNSPGNRTAIVADRQNYKPPAVNFNSPSLSDAKSLFKSIIASNSSAAAPLDGKYLNSFLTSFAAVSSLDGSVSLLRHMTKAYPPFVPDRSTYHVLLCQSCKAPEPTLTSVHKTLNLMADDGFPPDNATTDIAVRTLCTSDRLDHAVELVKEMCIKRLPPDYYTYNYILKQLCRSRTVSTVNNFMKELRESFQCSILAEIGGLLYGCFTAAGHLITDFLAAKQYFYKPLEWDIILGLKSHHMYSVIRSFCVHQISGYDHNMLGFCSCSPKIW